jgi:hypothetical protein
MKRKASLGSRDNLLNPSKFPTDVVVGGASGRYLQMPPDVSRYLQMPPDVSRCLQMSPDESRCLQMSPSRCLQMPPDVSR